MKEESFLKEDYLYIIFCQYFELWVTKLKIEQDKDWNIMKIENRLSLDCESLKEKLNFEFDLFGD